VNYTAETFLADLAAPYAWPGGYPRYFICADGEALSFPEAEHNKALIVDAINGDPFNSEWRVVGCEINWEDQDLICVSSGERIQSAYGEDS
jgi:hypothetical protein